jgi:hypothetical protein
MGSKSEVEYCRTKFPLVDPDAPTGGVNFRRWKRVGLPA